MLAAAGLCTVEVCATSYRGHSLLQREKKPVTEVKGSAGSDECDSIAIGTLSASESSSTVLVLGNPNPVTDGEWEVTLRTIPVSQGDRTRSPALVHHVVQRVSTPMPEALLPTAKPTTTSTKAPQAERVYFLPATIQPTPGSTAHVAVPCSLATVNARTLIYIDQRIRRDEALMGLVAAIDSASTSTMIETVERLVGTVADLDHDGHLTIVITSEVGRLGQQNNPVYGITRPSDFIRGVDRPHGNNSDVIFLSSSLPVSKQLHAVLCHEWCHAAVFSRRFENSGNAVEDRYDEDWLNEAIAHVVEVASSGSDSNVANRIQKYCARPGNSPLVIRDYCLPEYWRNDGVRGAGYLFLDWYLKRSDDNGLQHLLGTRSLDVASLEAIERQSFDELFRSWTIGMGEQLAGEIRECEMNGAKSPRMTHHRWKLVAGQEQTLILRIGGTCADFVRIECSEDGAWQLIATHSTRAPIQATLLPIDVQ
ncbi:MAG: shpI [Schlesneria sp.]|nr:shpI [Schlesneria sp.]